MDDLREIGSSIMERHWRQDFGFTLPNPDVYPSRWLWDSCFHSIIWASLGDDRCERELETLFASERGDGFLPHMWYPEPDVSADKFWGVPRSSTLVQPPMFGHAIAFMARAGRSVAALLEVATRSLWWILRHRRAASGLVYIVHPWESGFDNHPRWDSWFGDPDDRENRFLVKGELVRQLEIDSDGAAVGSTGFSVCSASFNAMVAWNAREIAELTGDEDLLREAAHIAVVLDEFWDPEIQTWADSDPSGVPGSAVRAADSLLASLVTPDADLARTALGTLVDPASFGTLFGPSGIAVCEPSFDSSGYGRGGTWPQLMYLLREAARQRDCNDIAEHLTEALVRGARASGFAEFWDCHTGGAEGAVPQSWSCLAMVP